MRLTGTAPSLRYRSAIETAHPWRDPGHVVVETCVEDIEGVRVSARAGADRAELCDNLAAGGTTPSIGAVEAAIFAAAVSEAEIFTVEGEFGRTNGVRRNSSTSGAGGRLLPQSTVAYPPLRVSILRR